MKTKHLLLAAVVIGALITLGKMKVNADTKTAAFSCPGSGQVCFVTPQGHYVKSDSLRIPF